MTEENKKEESKTETETQAQIEERMYSAKEVERKQSDFIRQITELKGQLESINQTQEEEQRKQLEEQNKFKELYTIAETEKEKIKSEYENKLFNLEVDKNLIESGIQNEYIRIGLKSKYAEVAKDQDFSTWLESVKVSQPEIFNQNSVTTINTNNQSVKFKTSDQNSKINEEIAKEYSRSTDLEKRAIARDFYEKKYRQQLQ